MKNSDHLTFCMHTARLALVTLTFMVATIEPVRAQPAMTESADSTSQSIAEARARVKAAEIDLKRAKAKLAVAQRTAKQKVSLVKDAQAGACKQGGESCTDWGSVCCPGLMCAGGLNAICIPRNP
jgi:hypothetical protein